MDVPRLRLPVLISVDKTCFGVTEYGKLTKKAKDFLKSAEDDIGSPITLISTGPEMTQIIDLRE